MINSANFLFSAHIKIAQFSSNDIPSSSQGITLTDVCGAHEFSDSFAVIVVDEIMVEKRDSPTCSYAPASNILIAFMWAALSCISESSEKKKPEIMRH